MKYWEVLLNKQRERGKDGLTLPFLIGSQLFLFELGGTNKQNISDLVQDIVINSSFVVCIRYCIGTQTLILERGKPRNMVYFPCYKGQDQANLSVGIMLKEKFGLSVKVLIDQLTEEFQGPINHELFSAVPNVDGRSVKWSRFTNDDILFIEKSYISL